MTKLNLDIGVSVNGIENVVLILNELQESVEKTKALAGALVKACDEINITLHEH